MDFDGAAYSENRSNFGKVIVAESDPDDLLHFINPAPSGFTGLPELVQGQWLKLLLQQKEQMKLFFSKKKLGKNKSLFIFCVAADKDKTGRCF